jgi:hypothetical protein
MRKTIIWLFVIALSIRAVIAVVQMTYGINNSLNFDRYLYGQFNPGLELYHDFQGYYVQQLIDLNKGMIPYRDFAYSYPPLFLYSLYPFYLIGGSNAASIPIWLSDAATAPLIYLTAQRFTTQRLSLIAGIAYAVSPFFLIYEGYLWYSSQPMTFFMVLSIYLLFTQRPLLAASTFAICVLFKQELILLLPVFIIWYFKKYPRDILSKSLIVIGTIIFAVSLPFLLITPGHYITSMSYGLLDKNYSPSLYPSTSGVAQLANSVSFHKSLSCDTISSTWRSLVCNYGNFTYTDAKLIPPWTVIFSAAFMEQISLWLFFPLLAVTTYNLIRLRRNRVAVNLSASLILTTFLAIFSIEVHQIYRYYLIPAYVFPLISCRSRGSICVAIAMPLVSLVLPSGSIQLVIPLLDVLGVLLLNQKSTCIVADNIETLPLQLS